MWWRSDPFFGVLVIMAFGMMVVAALTVIVYRRTEIFDIFLTAWCIDGIVPLIRGVILRGGITAWTRRPTFLFFALLAFLVLSTVFGMYLRSVGR